MFHYFDHTDGTWKVACQPTAEDIAAALMAAVDAGPACASCDAVVQLHIAEDCRVLGHTTVHADDCPRRAA